MRRPSLLFLPLLSDLLLHHETQTHCVRISCPVKSQCWQSGCIVMARKKWCFVFHGDSSVALLLLQAGLHMLVEKPVSIKSASEVLQLSQRLQELQQQKKLVISVGYQMRYLPAVEVGNRARGLTASMWVGYLPHSQTSHVCAFDR